jgi:hypothetical protein
LLETPEHKQAWRQGTAEEQKHHGKHYGCENTSSWSHANRIRNHKGNLRTPCSSINQFGVVAAAAAAAVVAGAVANENQHLVVAAIKAELVETAGKEKAEVVVGAVVVAVNVPAGWEMVADGAVAYEVDPYSHQRQQYKGRQAHSTRLPVRSLPAAHCTAPK